MADALFTLRSSYEGEPLPPVAPPLFHDCSIPIGPKRAVEVGWDGPAEALQPAHSAKLRRTNGGRQRQKDIETLNGCQDSDSRFERGWQSFRRLHWARGRPGSGDSP